MLGCVIEVKPVMSKTKSETLLDIPVMKKRCCIGNLSVSDLFRVLSITLHFPGGKCLILLV